MCREHPDLDFKFLFLTDGFNLRNTEFNAVLGLAQLAWINKFIRRRNCNYQRFVAACRRYPEHLFTLEVPDASSFVLPFLFRRKQCKEAFQAIIAENGIESRPLIGGNLLRQPFLRQYYDPARYPNADFLHENAFYIGNNQFVEDRHLDVLEQLMSKFFRS